MSVDDDADPADLAASAPESPSGFAPDDGDTPVYAVGIGPGNPDYLTPLARRALREANVVVGFETVLDYVRSFETVDIDEALPCGYSDEAETLETFADRVADGERGAAVLMGDPNHSGYQFVGKVQAAVEPPVRIVPGISSLQVAASRARTPLEETTFVTLHKRGPLGDDLARLVRDAGERHLLVLPRPYDWMPEDVAARLRDGGAPDCDALVLERLTHADEAITKASLSSLAADAGGEDPEDTAFSDMSVVAVRKA